MIVIFGIRRRASRLATVFALCRVCGSPAAQAITRVRTFFSLFFVLVVPLGSTYRSTCTLCGRTVKITREEAEQVAVQSQGAAPPTGFPPPTGPATWPPPATAPSPPAMPPAPPGAGA